MALTLYRRCNYETAFPAPAGVISTRNVRPRYTQMMGMARYGSLFNNRGTRYGRQGGYRSPFYNRSMATNPVYPRPEVKAFDNTFNVTSIDASGTNAAFVLNSLASGTGLGQRIGNQIAMKNCYYQYVLNFGTGPVPNAIRHLLVWDKQPNGNGALITDVLINTGIPLTSPMNLSNRDRFVILADERTTLSPNGDQIRIISGFRKINQRSDFNATTGNIPTTGALLAYFMSDETVLANEPTVYGTWRIRFIDC